MNIHCLGTNGFYPTSSAQTSCYMIPELGIIFDAGTGIYRSLELVQTSEVHLFLSHAHLDHSSSLIFFIKYKVKVTVYAIPEVVEAIKILFSPPFYDKPIPFAIVTLSGQKISLQSGALISYFPLVHRGPCVGFLLEYQNKKVSYVTDSFTCAESSFCEILREVDFLMLEVYFPAGQRELAFSCGHTSADEAVNFCLKANPKKVVIVHHNPSGAKEEILEFMQKSLPNVELAQDEKIFVV